MTARGQLFILIYISIFPFIRTQHSFYSTSPIDNVLIHKEKIFVGAVNRLDVLSSDDLSLVSSVSTGPQLDSPFCSIDGSSCLKKAKPLPTDNRNHILLAKRDGILACGSIRQGICNIHSISNISQIIWKGEVPIASNSLTGTTSAVLLDEDNLMVATSYNFDSPYRDSFPAVAMREAPEYQIANSGSLEGEASVFIRSDYRTSFSVQYIYSFIHEHFVYFAAVQPTSDKTSKRLVTKLIRVCKDDKRFASYSEIELQCRGSDNSNRNMMTSAVIHNDTLITAFSSTDKPSETAVCQFSLARIKMTFWYNVDRCRSGTSSIGMPHIGRDAKCVNKAHLPLSEDSCELGVGGTIEALEMASVEVNSRILSMTVIADPFLIFAGTDDGQIIQFAVGSSGQLSEYGRRSVSDAKSGREVRSILVKGGNMVVHLTNAISLLPIAICSHLTSCSECLISSDPLCKWCPSSSQCSSSFECPNAVVQKCPTLNGAPIPDRMSVSERKEVKIRINHLPEPHGFKYECVFGGHSTTAKWDMEGVLCKPPRLASNESGRVELSIRTSNAHIPLLTHNFTFFDCSQFSTCSSCTSSHFGCDWCAIRRICSMDGECGEENSAECVEIAKPQSTSINIPKGRNSTVSFTVRHLEKLKAKSDFFCSTTISGLRKKTVASIGENEVICPGILLNYVENISNMTVPLDFLQNDEVLDRTSVNVYDCSLLASDCSLCVSLNPSLYNCSWCGGKCSFDCENKLKTATELCDKPTILQFSPRSGPIEGGTLITIRGRDLGTKREDVEDRIYIGGSKCILKEYQISKMITCVLEKGSGSGVVRISVGRSANRIVESSLHYNFLSISLFSISPWFGPVSGGTKVIVYGQNLNIGTNATLYIGESPCRIIQRNSSHSLTCLTSKSTHPMRVDSVRLRVDRSERILETVFEYRPDPLIVNVEPLTSFQSGGRMVTVQGSHFDSIQSARMFLLDSQFPPSQLVSEMGICQIVNSSTIFCITPRMANPIVSRSTFARYPIGFLMDQVQSVRHLGGRLQMTVVPDPQFLPFKGVRAHHGDQPLILDGEHLGNAAEPQDYKIFIGSERCYVTLIDSRQLVCAGPQNQPEATDENGTPLEGGRPMVTVSVGQIRYELGLIEYSDGAESTRMWILVLFTIGALFVVLLLFFVLWKKRRAEKERDYRKIQMQMENLESNVRKECKQAFAELQTSLSTCGSEDLDPPHFNSIREFTMRLLWTEGAPHPSASLYGSTLPVTLAQFSSLLSSKHFVFSLVETAESDPSMCPSEKNLLSSLIIATLSTNFEYCTRVVLSLLSAHIAKTVHNRSSELLFRKSESLVEKLFSKWFSICLYDYLADETGLKFFTLYRALKLQSERGPVDAITGQVRYTINEAKLLRETVDDTPLECFVMNLDGRGPFTVHLLACDSISQTKQKILDTVFRHSPHSQRPTLHQFDIEWQDPSRGNVLLTDGENLTSSKGNRRLNTLSTYAIHNNALILMMPASKGTLSHRYSLADSGQSSWSSIDRSSNPYYTTNQFYHITTPCKSADKRRKLDESIPKNIPEVYLTRLLTSKGTVQKYIDDFLEALLFLEDSQYPVVLKYVFDYLDDEAARNGVPDGVVLSQWKSNCWVLRMWAGLIKNPKILFDVGESPPTDGNLSVIAQTIMDCFSTGDPVLGVDSPSSRLLFAKDISRLRPLSADLFKRIRKMPRVSEELFVEELNNITNNFNQRTSSSVVLSELLTWVRGNGIRLLEVLSADPMAVEQRLPHRLSQVINLSMEQENIYATLN